MIQFAVQILFLLVQTSFLTRQVAPTFFIFTFHFAAQAMNLFLGFNKNLFLFRLCRHFGFLDNDAGFFLCCGQFGFRISQLPFGHILAVHIPRTTAQDDGND